MFWSAWHNWNVPRISRNRAADNEARIRRDLLWKSLPADGDPNQILRRAMNIQRRLELLERRLLNEPIVLLMPDGICGR